MNVSNNSITGAKLLNGVEKSYDKGKHLLDRTKHKENRNVESFNNYITKVEVDGNDYLVSATVQKKYSGASFKGKSVRR